MSMADVELLFGVLGGGSLGGQSGSEIQKDLNSIVDAINKNPFKIKFEADKSSMRAMRSELVALRKELSTTFSSLQQLSQGLGVSKAT